MGGDHTLPTPTAARLELSLRLRARRDELGLSAAQVAGGLGLTRNYVSLIENDKTLIAEDTLEAICGLLDVPSVERQELAQLREAARGKGWWTQYGDPAKDDIIRFYGLEAGATSIRAYEGQIINGLLQTEDYARELMQADPRVSDVDVTTLITLRQRRQSRITRDRPQLMVVMNQAVLLQVVTTVRTLEDQLHHLIHLAGDEPNVDIRIVPFHHPAGGATTSTTFYLLDFDREHLPTVAWLEAGQPLGIHIDPKSVGELAIRHDNALDAALDAERSLELIRRCAEVVKHGPPFL